jgi:hypothetical protein
MKRFVPILVSALLLSLVGQPSNAEDNSCLQPPTSPIQFEPILTTSGAKDLKFIVSWAFEDPENCIVGMDYNGYTKNNFYFKAGYHSSEWVQFPTFWILNRSGKMVLVSAEVEFPLTFLNSLTQDGTNQNYFWQSNKSISVLGYLKVKKSNKYTTANVVGNFSVSQLWGYWFSKNQEIFSSECNAVYVQPLESLNSKINWKILESGDNPKVEISITQDSDCIFLVHSGPLKSTNPLKGEDFERQKTLAEHPFWDLQGTGYFSQILGNPDQIIQIGLGEFTESKPRRSFISSDSTTKVISLPTQIISHKDSIVRSQEVIKVTSLIDSSTLKNSSVKNVTLYVGFYSWYQKEGFSTSSGWRVTLSGNTWTARYSSGVTVSGGKEMLYQTQAIVIPVSDLLLDKAEEARIQAETDAKLKARQEADAKAAADLFKSWQEADAKAKAAAELKAKQEAEAKAAAELKAKQEAEAKAALAAKKKTTITCVKGKLVKKVTAVSPKCPAGYKKK